MRRRRQYFVSVAWWRDSERRFSFSDRAAAARSAGRPPKFRKTSLLRYNYSSASDVLIYRGISGGSVAGSETAAGAPGRAPARPSFAGESRQLRWMCAAAAPFARHGPSSTSLSSIKTIYSDSGLLFYLISRLWVCLLEILLTIHSILLILISSRLSLFYQSKMFI